MSDTGPYNPGNIRNFKPWQLWALKTLAILETGAQNLGSVRNLKPWQLCAL